MRTDAPRVGAHVDTAGPGITISVAQECRTVLPPRSYQIPDVTVTVTSQRPGVAGQMTIGANFNTPNGSYQGPTTTVGQGQFTATSSQVHARFILLPSGFPSSASARWLITPTAYSGALTYEQIACDPWVWWQWVTPIVGFLSRWFPIRPIPPRRISG